MSSIDEDRRRRLRDIEVKIQDPRSIINVDCLIDAVQNIMSDCDHPAIRKIKNIDAFVTRCKRYIHTYETSCGVNRSSLLKWLLLQNCLNMNGKTLFSSKSFPLISAGPQKPQKLTALKIKYEKFGPKILPPH